MKLYIPTVGDSIRLTADWTFDLYNEGRNYTLMEYVNDPRERKYRDNVPVPATLPAGLVLKVDRIYIRKGHKDFDSITFMLKGISTPARYEKWTDGSEYRIPKQPVRFWVKLPCANKIEFEPA